MQVKLTSQVTIDATPSEVFKYLRDPRRHRLWNPHLQSITGNKPFVKGSTYKTTSLLLGVKLVSTNTVTACEPDTLLEIRNAEAALEFRVTYMLEPSTEGTLLKCVTEVASTSHAFAFTRPVLRMLAKRELQSDLQALKIAVEQKLS
jgi:uncharacterized protein YndB with AHSA1/START domain